MKAKTDWVLWWTVFTVTAIIVFATVKATGGEIVEIRNQNQISTNGIILPQPEIDRIKSSSHEPDEPTWSEVRKKRIETLLNKELANIHFEFNSSVLEVESDKPIEQIIEILQENQDVGIELSGHTDLMGSDNYNVWLSIERVATVRDALLKRGIASNRIFAGAFGERKPLIAEEKKERLNRRVEAKVFDLLSSVDEWLATE